MRKTGDDRGALLEALAGVGVSRESLARLEAFVDLLIRWQKRINLIGPATVEDVWRRHIADALQLIPLVEGDPGAIIDLGSGGGIPGLPLAIAWPAAPKVFAHLVESNAKKAAFLRAAIRATAAPARVHETRIEALKVEDVEPRPKLVVARALAPLPRLLELAFPFLAAGAIGLFHKGQHVEDELTESTKYWRIIHRLHPSRLPGGGSIVEIREIARVPPQ
jgi:16S rRNA (guanine527-N7)-methyltransferase